MKKAILSQLFTALTIIAIPVSAYGGGLQTNTNRSAAYLRLVARGTSYSPDAVFFNPAGVVFMEDGWHLDFSAQQVYQTRTTESTFAPFAQNINNLGISTKEYTGYTFAPFVPNLHAVWKKDKWAVMASLEVGGGGGGVDYAKGLGSFETIVSVLPSMLTSSGLPTNMYGLDMNLNATSIRATGTLGAAYKIIPCLSVSLQANINYAYAKYNGELSNVMINPQHPILNPTGGMVNAQEFFTKMGRSDLAERVSDKKLDAKQTGISISPIVAVCFNMKGWTANVKYEFKSPLTLKNSTTSDIVIDGEGMFPDGGTEESDIPAMLTAAVGYDFGKVRLSGEWHHYFDKQAHNCFSDEVLGASNEYLAGVEVDVSKKVLLSCGLQRSVFNLNLEEYDEDNFYLNSTSVGFGGGVKVSKLVTLEAGCFLSFYDSKKATYPSTNKTNVYKRSSISYGVGAIFKF